MAIEPPATAPAESPDIDVDPEVSRAVLRALSMMARNSKRHQAELGVALQRAGITLSPAVQDAVIANLRETDAIEQLIPLDDGAILVSVTPSGMNRAGR